MKLPKGYYIDAIISVIMAIAFAAFVWGACLITTRAINDSKANVSIQDNDIDKIGDYSNGSN